MTRSIRSAQHGDYESLCALFDELDEFHRVKRPDFFRPFEGPARPREQVERWCDGPDSTLLVAEEKGALLGLAVLLTRAPSDFAGAVPRKVIVIDNLVLTARGRGRGIGRDLLEAATAWARTRGATHVELGVHDVNQDALRFYRRHGFAVSVNWMSRAA